MYCPPPSAKQESNAHTCKAHPLSVNQASSAYTYKAHPLSALQASNAHTCSVANSRSRKALSWGGVSLGSRVNPGSSTRGPCPSATHVSAGKGTVTCLGFPLSPSRHPISTDTMNCWDVSSFSIAMIPSERTLRKPVGSRSFSTRTTPTAPQGKLYLRFLSIVHKLAYR